MENKHTILNEYTNMEQVLRKAGRAAVEVRWSKEINWTKEINTEGNADSRTIIKWSQSHATSNINKYKSKLYEPQQKNRLGTVGNKLPGGLN